MEIKQIYFGIYILIIVFNLSNAEKFDVKAHNRKIFNEYIEMDRMLKEFADRGVKLALPYLMQARENINISTNCTRNMFQLLSGLRRLTESSLKFLDASGKVPSGLMAGNFIMFGEYNECIETNSFTKDGKLDFQGQYCSVKYRPHLPRVKQIPKIYDKIDGLENATRNMSNALKFMFSRLQVFYGIVPRMGVCVPSGCTKQDVTSIAKYVSEMAYMNATVEYCLKKGDIYFWTKPRTVVVCIFVLLGILTVISTLLDNFSSNYTNSSLSIASKALMCFSLTRNFPMLLSTKSSEKSLSSFHAIRILGVFWIILGHEYMMNAFLLAPNHSMNYEKMFPRFFSQIILNGFASVDTFFFISGFLNSYIRTSIKQNGRKQPGFLKIIMHRLWRIYPTLIVGHLIFYLLHVPGPYSYTYMQADTSRCDRIWWRNFLFINNLFDAQDVCLQQSWYLSVDMQLFLVSLLTVPVLLRNPKKGVYLNLFVICIGSICSAIWWWLKELPPHVDFTLIAARRVILPLQGYILPFQHTGPYFIGILMGYIIQTKKEIKISKKNQVLGWCIASFLFLSMLFMTKRWNAGNKYTPAESILFGAFNRSIFTIGFAWMVFCCITGHGGIINYILSLKFWCPLGKMSYMVYMISPLVQLFYHANLGFPFDASNIVIIWTYFGNVCISLLLSLALVVTIESPFIALEKILVPNNGTNTKSSTEKQNEIDCSVKKENGLNENEIDSCVRKENGLNENEKYMIVHL